MFELTRFLNDLITNHAWLCLILAFVLGAIVGSYLNVCIYRLPLDKSLFWPGSRCGSCLQKIRFYPDNIPLVSYWLLGGKCRTCGTSYSSRYFWIELLTASAFAGLFYLEVVENVHNIGALRQNRVALPAPWQFLLVWLYHCALVSLLIVATFTDVDHWTIPIAVTIPGTILGIIGGALGPWPWPMDVGRISQIDPGWMSLPYGGFGLSPGDFAPLPAGMQRWPVFMPLPDWLPPGTWQLGLATSVVGAAVGALGMRLIRIIFSWGLRKEAMGLGDADLMMMIGAFLGWQALVLVLVYSVLLGLVYAIVLLVRNAGHELPFGPFLAGGAILALIVPWFYITSQNLFFDLQLVLVLGGVSAVLALCLTIAIRMVRLITDAT